MEELLNQISQCKICEAHLPLGPRPVATANVNSKIVVVGQAPGTKVHASGVPWDDAVGSNLESG